MTRSTSKTGVAPTLYASFVVWRLKFLSNDATADRLKEGDGWMDGR